YRVPTAEPVRNAAKSRRLYSGHSSRSADDQVPEWRRDADYYHRRVGFGYRCTAAILLALYFGNGHTDVYCVQHRVVDRGRRCFGSDEAARRTAPDASRRGLYQVTRTICW